MILGYINFNSRTKDSSFEAICKLTSWPGSVDGVITVKEFNGIYMFDPRTPVKGENNFVFHLKEKGIVVLMDGWVYNRKEICRRLNFSYEVVTDPELVCMAFLQWGNGFANELNGDFAICIFLEYDNKVLFYRDHLGVRPLVVARHDTGVYFSTDGLGLCKALFSDHKPDPSFLLSFFLHEKKAYSALPSRNAIKVKPGHYWEIEAEKEKLVQYWHPEKISIDRKLTRKNAVSQLKELTCNAVAIRSDKKWNASVHVSGGLDSSLLAALLREEYKHQDLFYGFTWSPDFDINDQEIEFDERHLIGAVCSKDSIVPVHSNYTKTDYLDWLSNWRYPSEMISEKSILESAESRKINLIFSGWGGDDFISMHNSGLDASLIREGSLKSFLKMNPVSRPRHLLYKLFYHYLFPSLRENYSNVRTQPEYFRYLQKSLGHNHTPKKDRFPYRSRRAIHLFLLKQGHLARRCEHWYVGGQRHGVEYRYPLLDKRIVEFMLKIPSHCLAEPGQSRILMREIGRDVLPEEIRMNQSKTDHVATYFFRKAFNDLKYVIMSELEDFKTNSELSFFDFELFESDLHKKTGGNSANITADDIGVLYLVKVANEFTKSWRSYSP